MSIRIKQAVTALAALAVAISVAACSSDSDKPAKRSLTASNSVTIADPGPLKFTIDDLQMLVGSYGIIQVVPPGAPPVVLDGSIDASGKVTVPKDKITIPGFSYYGGLAQIAPVAVSDATGTLDPTTGKVNIDLKLVINVGAQVINDTCQIGTAANPLAVSLTTSPDTGEALPPLPAGVTGVLSAAAPLTQDGNVFTAVDRSIPVTTFNGGCQAARMAHLTDSGEKLAMAARTTIDRTIKAGTAPASGDEQAGSGEAPSGDQGSGGDAPAPTPEPVVTQPPPPVASISGAGGPAKLVGTKIDTGMTAVCPADAKGGCAAGGAASALVPKGAKPTKKDPGKLVQFGTSALKLSPGQSQKVLIPVSKPGAAVFKKKGSAKVVMTTSVTPQGGQTATVNKTAVLTAKKK